MQYILLAIALCSCLSAKALDFDTYFYAKTMRVDYFHTGNNNEEVYSLDVIKEEPYWGGSQTNLVDIFNYGKYKFEVYDSADGTLLYSRSYCTLFGEWQTIAEAKTTWRSFSESIVFPYPKKAVQVKFYAVDKRGVFHQKFMLDIDPNSYFVQKEQKLKYNNYKVHYSGKSSEKVDIVIIPEGYTQKELSVFKQDCKDLSKMLFKNAPYSENKDKFNIWAIEAPSKESGTDIPGKGVWKNTLLNSNFYTFDMERYLNTMAYNTVRDVASNAPYDYIYILVNTPKYGGAGIYNYYAICTKNERHMEYVFIHELGHSFGGLADEYYAKTVTYEESRPLDIEPWQPNVTTLANFDAKWKDLLDKSIPIPTPDTGIYKTQTGVFEGGAYLSKGVYRPAVDCTMKSAKAGMFCDVCKRAIQDMINFHTQ